MKPFTLTTNNADAWRGLILSGGATPSLSNCSSVTLAGALELLATAVALRDRCDLFEQLTCAADAGNSLWRILIAEWSRDNSFSLSGSDIHGVRKWELFRLRSVEDKTSTGFSLFLERFCRSTKAQEFPKGFASALSAVLDEMADNVIQHSGVQANGFSGIAGYHVEGGRAAFAVTDVGRGVLSTLTDSPEWDHLLTARAALRAIVAKGASSRVGQGPGEGFKQLFASLVDRNALVRLRSDESVLIIADGENSREGGEMRCPILGGFQISVNCATRTRATEAEISA